MIKRLALLGHGAILEIFWNAFPSRLSHLRFGMQPALVRKDPDDGAEIGRAAHVCIYR